MNLISLNLIKFPRTIKSLPFHFLKTKKCPVIALSVIPTKNQTGQFFLPIRYTQENP